MAVATHAQGWRNTGIRDGPQHESHAQCLTKYPPHSRGTLSRAEIEGQRYTALPANSPICYCCSQATVTTTEPLGSTACQNQNTIFHLVGDPLTSSLRLISSDLLPLFIILGSASSQEEASGTRRAQTLLHFYPAIPFQEVSWCCPIKGPTMSTKAPIYLKRGSRRGKKEKLRDILSSDMISPPLGDFRHTIHIGSGGGDNDFFGDLSFLQGKFHLLPGRQGHSLSHQRMSQGVERAHLNRPASVCGNPPSPEGSLLLKNAVSLPVIGGVQALTLPTSAPSLTSKPASTPIQLQIPPPKPPRLHLDSRSTTLPLPRRDPPQYPLQSPAVTSPLTPPSSKASPDTEQSILEDSPSERPYLSHASSLLSLHLDLGPSILDDVLQIMDNQRLGLAGACLHGGRQGIFT
ncbi:hypothetical protein JZ751_023249 [Albula glossodonta]|uniref:CRIB domain-containing protein n=1 Tax=Albula glossodonta TaxID=121402 RepID=A0A8T2PN54_9TELE|nr:hypothetical protein JZ751_023249 [Albula glossodonta]